MFASPRCRLFKGRDIVLQIFISIMHGDIVEKKCWSFEDNIICIKCTFELRRGTAITSFNLLERRDNAVKMMDVLLVFRA